MKMIYGVLVAGLVGLGITNANADGEYVRMHELHSFANAYNASHTNPWVNAEGGHPAASLYEHTDGKLYGTTPFNGPHQEGDALHSCSSGYWSMTHPEYFDKYCPGTVFRLNKSGTGFAVVYAFAGLDASDRNTTGYRPYSTLVPGPSGYLYGTATQGGSGDGSHAGCGVVFKFLPSNPSATFSIVHNFCSCSSFSDGATPYGSLVPDGHGDFYGATTHGTLYGNGSIFKLSEASPTTCSGDSSTVTTLTTLRAFGAALDYTVYAAPAGTNADGAGAFGSPVLDGTQLFGLTNYGGDSSTNTASCGGGFGTVYSYDTSTSMFYNVQDQACFSYAGLNTDQISAQSMIVGSDGNYYGTAQFGGANNTGYVFKFVPGTAPGTGTFTILHSFGAISAGSSPHYNNATNGAQPMSTLVEGHDHFLYGTTYYGGSNGTGIIFQIKKTGADFLILYTFPPAGKNSPGNFPHAGLIQGSDGRYYGTTYQGGIHGYGTVFAMDPPLSFEHTFNAELSTVYESAPILVTGLASSSIAISNGEYKIDAGSWTSSAGTVATGQTLRVRATSSSSYNTRVLATVVFGGIGNSSFGVTTKTGP